MPKTKSIPLAVQWALRERLEKHAATNWKEQCRAVILSFRGAFTYVDAFPSKQDYPSVPPSIPGKCGPLAVFLLQVQHREVRAILHHVRFVRGDTGGSLRHLGLCVSAEVRPS